MFEVTRQMISILVLGCCVSCDLKGYPAVTPPTAEFIQEVLSEDSAQLLVLRCGDDERELTDDEEISTVLGIVRRLFLPADLLPEKAPFAPEEIAGVVVQTGKDPIGLSILRFENNRTIFACETLVFRGGDAQEFVNFELHASEKP